MNDEMVVVSREPIHPGEFLREEYMPELGLTVAGLAQRIGVTRQTINDIVREKRALSPDMCLRLGRLFGTTPQFWMNMQAKVDMWKSLEEHRDDIEAIEPIAADCAMASPRTILADRARYSSSARRSTIS